MKKIINRIGLGIFLLVTFSCQEKMFTDDLAGFDPESDLSVYELALTNPGQSAGMIYMDIGSGDLFNYTDATEQPEKIDLIYLWGTSTGANLIAPDNTGRLSNWGSGRNVNENWFVKNHTKFIRLEKRAVPAEFFESIQSTADVKKAYNDLKILVEGQENYSRTDHGEDNQLRHVEAGDILGMITAKNVYAIAKVQSLVTGTTGNIALTVKLDKREEVPVRPIAPGEVPYAFDVAIDRLSDLSGRSLLDLAKGSAFSLHEGYYNQHTIDVIVYNNQGELTFSAPNNNDIPVLNEDVLEISSDWSVRTDTEFIRLKASSDTEQKWSKTQSNSDIKELYQTSRTVVEGYTDYQVDRYGPSKTVKGIQTGDLVLYWSRDRDIYGMIRITDSGPEYIDMQAKVNISDKTELQAPRLQEVSHSGVSGSSNSGYIDFKNAVIYHTEAEGEQYCADIDVLTARGTSTYHNLIEMTFDAGFGAFSGAWRDRVRTWPTRNDSDIYRMGYSTHTWQMYHDLKEDQSMWSVFQAEKENRIPTSTTSGGQSNDMRRIYPIDSKEILFIHNKTRNRLIAVKALNTSATSVAPISYRFKVVDLE